MDKKEKVQRNLLDQIFKQYSLTVRELEVIEALTFGHTSSKALAEYLKISESTANNHIDNISKKTSLPGKASFLSFIARELFAMMESDGVRQKPQSVLILDDEKDLAEILRTEFDERGYKTFVANKVSDETVALIKTEKIDLIVCDVVMPGMTGPEFLSLVKATLGYLPATVFISAFDTVDALKIKELGVHSLVKKPFQFGELLDNSLNAIGSR